MSATSYPTPKFEAFLKKIAADKSFVLPENNGFQINGGPLNKPGENTNTFLILSYCVFLGTTLAFARKHFYEHFDYVCGNEADDHHNLRALWKIKDERWIKDVFTAIEKVLDNQQAEDIVNVAWEKRADIIMENASSDLRLAVELALSKLNDGTLRVATQQDVGKWTVHQWLKKAVLLSFKITPNVPMSQGDLQFYDKVKSKFGSMTEAELKATGVRIVGPAYAREGSHIASGAILMPSFVNIGAYVGEGTMVDAFATVGSCAQIGKNVHLSGGVGIGGVLEPMQANPTIIEDNCFIGARSEVVEGVVVSEGCVLGMGVLLAQSTPVWDRETRMWLDATNGLVIPPYSVVISGQKPAKNKGDPTTYCAVIVKKVDAQTRSKTSINDLLRD